MQRSAQQPGAYGLVAHIRSDGLAVAEHRRQLRCQSDCKRTRRMQVNKHVSARPSDTRGRRCCRLLRGGARRVRTRSAHARPAPQNAVCMLHVACCTLRVARCVLHVACSMLRVARCTLHVALCTLPVVSLLAALRDVARCMCSMQQQRPCMQHATKHATCKNIQGAKTCNTPCNMQQTVQHATHRATVYIACCTLRAASHVACCVACCMPRVACCTLQVAS